jgi:hypothetical protein
LVGVDAGHDLAVAAQGPEGEAVTEGTEAGTAGEGLAPVTGREDDPALVVDGALLALAEVLVPLGVGRGMQLLVGHTPPPPPLAPRWGFAPP